MTCIAEVTLDKPRPRIVLRKSNQNSSRKSATVAMSSLRILASIAVLLSLISQATGDPAKPCDPDVCKLPDCFCSDTKIPGNLPNSSIPQIVMITFDAAVNTGFSLYEELFNGQLKNPNGCNIAATFFVSHEYSNYCDVQNLYHQRHEIADNSISRHLPASWWGNATEEELTEEMVGMREILRKWGNVATQDIKGYRAPYIQVGGNTEFKVLKDSGFLYESSMPTQWYLNDPFWPYTLEYRSTQDCEIGPCPTGESPTQCHELNSEFIFYLIRISQISSSC